jgi:hypothetical protein
VLIPNYEDDQDCPYGESMNPMIKAPLTVQKCRELTQSRIRDEWEKTRGVELRNKLTAKKLQLKNEINELKKMKEQARRARNNNSNKERRRSPARGGNNFGNRRSPQRGYDRRNDREGNYYGSNSRENRRDERR